MVLWVIISTNEEGREIFHPRMSAHILPGLLLTYFCKTPLWLGASQLHLSLAIPLKCFTRNTFIFYSSSFYLLSPSPALLFSAVSSFICVSLPNQCSTTSILRGSRQTGKRQDQTDPRRLRRHSQRMSVVWLIIHLQVFVILCIETCEMSYNNLFYREYVEQWKELKWYIFLRPK